MAIVSKLRYNYIQYFVPFEERELGFVDPDHHQIGSQQNPNIYQKY